MVASWGFVFPIPLGRQEAVGEPRRDGDSTLTFVVGEAGGLVPVEKGLGPRLGVGGGGQLVPGEYAGLTSNKRAKWKL